MMKLLNSVSSPEKCMWGNFICKVFVPIRWDNACLSSHRLKFEISSSLEAVKNSKLSQYLYSFCDSDSLGASCSMNSVRLESWPLLLSPILLTSYLITVDKGRRYSNLFVSWFSVNRAGILFLKLLQTVSTRDTMIINLGLHSDHI